MTVHVSVRSISALLLLSVSLLGLPADALAQSVVAPQKTAPTLAERLDRLAAELDRNRIDLHVPGAVLAIVRGEEVIFAGEFGVADIEKKTAVTPDTPFFIASATKAFTATLVGMLVDEGRMQWDDPVETYLPEFKLKVQSKDPNERATLRDVLSHRTGFTRMAFLEINRGLPSDEILRRASSAEALAPFRQRFLYNNTQYLAAGSAAGVAAGTSWHALMKERIFAPLGMAATRTSLREAWNDPRTARGYSWDEAGQRTQPLTLETLGIKVDGIAPAGAISSTALDMTAWLRFLLRQGVQNGKALISPAALTTTWTPQIPISDASGYGMGWFVSKWQGQRLIEHGGSIAGYSAEVGLLPDSNIGSVVLTNTQSALPTIATQLVPQYLLGELPPAASDVGDLKPYLGRYVANFRTFSNEVFTMRTTGSVRFPQSAVEGRFSSSTAGDDRRRTDLDLDGSVQIRTVLNKGRASTAVSGGRSTELTGKQLAQTRLGHPSVLFGDWRKFYDTVRVVRAGELGGRKIYVVRLESAGLPPALVSLDAETGDVLQTQQTMWSVEAGVAVAMPVTTTYSDYREVGGMRMPHRYIESTEMGGRMIFHVERVEVGVELAPDTFTLQPSTESGRGK